MSPRNYMEYPGTPLEARSPEGLVCKPCSFRPASVRPPTPVGLLLVVQFDRQALPVTVSGEYAPMLPANPWLYTGGEPIRGGRGHRTGDRTCLSYPKIRS